MTFYFNVVPSGLSQQQAESDSGISREPTNQLREYLKLLLHFNHTNATDNLAHTRSHNTKTLLDE